MHCAGYVGRLCVSRSPSRRHARKGACNSVYGEIQTWLPILFLVNPYTVMRSLYGHVSQGSS